jgi:glycine/serine hydroxymethyltransferase
VQLAEVATPEFKAYIQQVKRNIRALGDTLMASGNSLLTGFFFYANLLYLES